LKQTILEANLTLLRYYLVTFTWGTLTQTPTIKITIRNGQSSSHL